MFKPGDLVIISDDCDIQNFAGRTAIIVKSVGQDATDHSHGFYYQLHFADGNTHIFTHRELALLSKAERKENENR
jgi:hypothetical protein